MVAELLAGEEARSDGAGGLGSCAGRPRRPEAGRRGVTGAGADRRRCWSSAGGVGVSLVTGGTPSGNGGQNGARETSMELGG